MKHAFKTMVAAFGIALCANSGPLFAGECKVDNLMQGWMRNKVAAKNLFANLPEIVAHLKTDADYGAGEFGSESRKGEFTTFIKNQYTTYYYLVAKAAVLKQEPCYVCLIREVYTIATDVANTCTQLVSEVRKRPGFEDSDGFLCDKVKDFTRLDMENPRLGVSYWDDARRYQKNLIDDLKVPGGFGSPGPDQNVENDIERLRTILTSFVEFHNTHPGDAAALKRDVEGTSCTWNGRPNVSMMLRTQ